MCKIGVVLASYNGEKYIREQIQSIIQQFDENCILLITDDGSTDNTIKIINEFASKDSRIKLCEGPKKGVIANFENGIRRINADIIFLADQDDIWLPNKIQEINKVFENDPKITCVVHDVIIVDEKLHLLDDSFFEFRHAKTGLIHNLYKNSFMGSAMAFRKEIKKWILPIPSNVPMHDQWIGLVNERKGKVVFLGKKLGLYRRHGDNVSSFKHGSLLQMICNRCNLFFDLVKLRRGQ